MEMSSLIFGPHQIPSFNKGNTKNNPKSWESKSEEEFKSLKSNEDDFWTKYSSCAGKSSETNSKNSTSPKWINNYRKRSESGGESVSDRRVIQTPAPAAKVLTPCWSSGFGKCQGGSWVLIIFLILSLFCPISEECPLACECKWKSGKESVICANPKGANKLNSIPSGLEPGTQVLDLSGNNIPGLPGNVFLNLNLLNLQKIFLSDCSLKTLDKNVFFRLNNLVELDLSMNRLEFIPTHTFDQIPELRELKFNSNPIARISNDAFISLSNLVRLELTGCRLGTIEPGAFKGLTSLEWLRLDNNRLYTIQAISLYPLKNVHGVEMHGNPWNCSCTLQPLRDWMIKNNVPFGVPPVCSEPQRLAGKSWDQLQLEEFACLPKVKSSSTTGLPKVSKVIEGENATLLCRLQATSDTQVRWMNGNKPVIISTVGGPTSQYLLTESFAWEPGEADGISGGGTTSVRSSSKGKTLGTKTSKLTVLRTKLRDSGTYSCRAESRAGSVSDNFTLLVLQNKAEPLSGRFLLYGAAVAALLTLSICLLLLCLVFVCGRWGYGASRILTEDKFELNHVGGHNLGQNGCGGTVPLISTNHHTNSNNSSAVQSHIHNNHNQPVIHNKSAIAANNVTHRPINNLTNYKALPTTEPDSEIEDNCSEQEGTENDLDVVIVDNNKKRNGHPASSKMKSSSVPKENEQKSRVPPAIRPRGLNPKTNAHISTDFNSTANGPRRYGTPQTREEHQQKYPDLIDEQMPFVVQSPPDFSRQPEIGFSNESQIVSNQLTQNRQQPKARPQMGSYGRGSYLHHHRRVNSESQSPLMLHQQQAGTMNSSGYSVLSSSSNDSPYGSSCTYQTHLTSSNRTLTSAGGKISRSNAQPFNNFDYTSSGTNFHHHPQIQYLPHQRHSMPTSPVHQSRPLHEDSLYFSYHRPSAIPRHHSSSHDGSSVSQSMLEANSTRVGSDPVAPTECEYDYHAAQLSAFLEEYRVLQMELMHMSASLQQVTDSNPKGSSGVGSTNSNMSNNANSNNSSSSSNVNKLPNSLSLQTSNSSSQQQQNANPILLNNSLQQQQQQLKSILKNCSGNNNNYMT